MRNKIVKRIKIITGDPVIVESETNEFLDGLADKGIEIDDMIVNPNPLQVTITWTIREIIPENIKDEYSLRGIHDLCTKCKYCELPDDKRFKTAWCKLHKEEINKRDSACIDYYQMMNKNK